MKVIECGCRKISKEAERIGLDPTSYYCKKCFKAFLKNREKALSEIKGLGDTINFELRRK